MWTGLILAGGQSRRMGSDKATLRIGGRTLLVRAIEVVRAAGGEPLLVGRRRPDGEVSGAPQTDETESFPGASGPLPALRHGLAACGTRAALALACDLPLFTPALARFLVAATDRFDAVVPRAGGELHVLAAAYTTTCLPAIERQMTSGSGAVHGFLAAVRLRIVEEEELLPFGGPETLLNVNDPRDLARVREILDARCL